MKRQFTILLQALSRLFTQRNFDSPGGQTLAVRAHRLAACGKARRCCHVVCHIDASSYAALGRCIAPVGHLGGKHDRRSSACSPFGSSPKQTGELQ